MGKTHSKPLAARHDRGTAWARHAMCESAFRGKRGVSYTFPDMIIVLSPRLRLNYLWLTNLAKWPLDLRIPQTKKHTKIFTCEIKY
jgi:hypothetical protein